MAQEPTKMDISELKKCVGCGKGMAHTGGIHFYEVTVNQCILDLKSIQQMHGLEMLMGGAAPIARALAPSTNVAYRMEPKRHLICSECAMGEYLPTILLMEEE